MYVNVEIAFYNNQLQIFKTLIIQFFLLFSQSYFGGDEGEPHTFAWTSNQRIKVGVETSNRLLPRVGQSGHSMDLRRWTRTHQKTVPLLCLVVGQLRASGGWDAPEFSSELVKGWWEGQVGRMCHPAHLTNHSSLVHLRLGPRTGSRRRWSANFRRLSSNTLHWWVPEGRNQPQRYIFFLIQLII